jgi:hypothetical protein
LKYFYYLPRLHDHTCDSLSNSEGERAAARIISGAVARAATATMGPCCRRHWQRECRHRRHSRPCRRGGRDGHNRESRDHAASERTCEQSKRRSRRLERACANRLTHGDFCPRNTQRCGSPGEDAEREQHQACESKQSHNRRQEPRRAQHRPSQLTRRLKAFDRDIGLGAASSG